MQGIFNSIIMLELAKVYRQKIYIYVSADKRYLYNVAVKSEPEKKTRFVVVTIYDHKYQDGDKNHQSQSCITYTCCTYRVDSMLRRCQPLFDAGGLIRNGLGYFSYLECPVIEK